MSKTAGGKGPSSSLSASAHSTFGAKATKAMSRAELEAFFRQHGGSRGGDSLGAAEGNTSTIAGAKMYTTPSSSSSTNIPSNYNTATSPYAPKRDGDGEFSRKLLEATRKKFVINSPEEEREQKEKEEHGIAIIHTNNNNTNALKNNNEKSGETKTGGGSDNTKTTTRGAASRRKEVGPTSLTSNSYYHHQAHPSHNIDDEIEDFLSSKARDEAYVYENPFVVSPSGAASKGSAGVGGCNEEKADGADALDIYEPYANLNDAPSAPFLFGAPRRLKQQQTNNDNQQESNINTLVSAVHSSEDKNGVDGGSSRGLQFTHYTYDGTPYRSNGDAQHQQEGASNDANANALVDVPSRTTELIQQAKAIAARANGGASGAGREYPFVLSSHSSRTVHGSTEADREAHEEQLYLNYVKLQEQQDEIDAYRRKLGWDQLQGNFMGIKTVLDSGNEAIDREGEQSLGDWDTYNRVQETLKTFVFRRAPEASREEGPDFVAMLKTRLHRSRETIDALKRSVNDLSEALKASSREAKAAQQLAKEQGAELQRLKSLNTALSVQMRHMRAHSQHRITAIASGSSNNNTNNNGTSVGGSESFGSSSFSPNGAGSGGNLAEQLVSLRNDYMELASAHWKSETENRMLRVKINGGGQTDGEGGEIPQMIGGDIGMLMGKGGGEVGADGKGNGGVSSVINNGSLFARSQNKGNGNDAVGGNGPSEKQAYSRSRFVTAQMQAHTRAVVALSSGRRAWRRRLEAAERDKMSALDIDAGVPLVPASGGPSSFTALSLSSPNTNGTGGSLALALQKTNMRMIELAKAHLGEKERKQREENSKKHGSIAVTDAAGACSPHLQGGKLPTASCGTSPMVGGLMLPDVDGDGSSKDQQQPHSSSTTTPKSGWRILHEKILGNFALSRAEVLRREELHVRRLRHKIALLSEELAMAAADRDLIADYYQRSEQEVDELHAALAQAKAKTERLEEQIHEWGDQRQHITTVGQSEGGGGSKVPQDEVCRADSTSFASTLLAGLDLDSLTEEERQKIMISADADAISSAAQLHALANIFNTRMGTYERQLKAKEAEVERLLRETHQLSTMQHQGMALSMAESGASSGGGVVISTTNAAVLSEEVRRLENDALKKERTLIAYEQEIKRLRAIVLAAQDEVVEERAAVRLGISMPTAARVVSNLRARARKAVLRVKQRNAEALRAIQAQEKQEERARQRELQGANYEDGDANSDDDRNDANGTRSRSDTIAQMSSPLSESLKAEKEIAIQLLLLARRDDHRDLVQSLLESVKEDEAAEDLKSNKKDNGSSYTTGYSSSQQHHQSASQKGRRNDMHYSSSSHPALDETTWCSARRLWLRLIGSREEQWRTAKTLEERLMAEKRLSDAYAYFMLFEQLGDSRAHPAVACAAALRVISQAAAPIALLESGGVGGGGGQALAAQPANTDGGLGNATGLTNTRRESHEGSSSETEDEAEEGERERVSAYSAVKSSAVIVGKTATVGKPSSSTAPQSTTRTQSGDSQAVASKMKRPSDEAEAKDGRDGKHTLNPKTKNKTNAAKRIKHKNLTLADADLNGDAAAASRRNAIEVEREYRALVDLVKGRTSQLSALAERREELADQLRAFGGGAVDVSYANGGVEVSTEEEQGLRSHQGSFKGSAVAASSQSSSDTKQGLIGGGYSPSFDRTKKSKKSSRSNPEKSVVIPSSPHVLYYRYRTRGADETVVQAAARFGIADLAVILATAMTFIPDTVQALMAESSNEGLSAVFSKSGPFYVPLLTLAQLEAVVGSGVGRGLLKRDKDGDRYSADAGVDKSMVGVMRGFSETVASSSSASSPSPTAGTVDECFFVLRRRVRASDTLASIAADLGVPVESIVYVGTTTVIDHETRRLQQKMGYFDAQNPLMNASSSSPLPSSQIVNHQMSGSASTNMSHSDRMDEDEKVRLTAHRSGTPPPTNTTTGTDPTAGDGSVVPLSSSTLGFVDVINDRRFAQVVDIRIPTASAFAMLAARATGGAASGLNSGNINAGTTTTSSAAVGAAACVVAVRDEDLLLIAYTALSRLQKPPQQGDRREGEKYGSPSTMSLETIATVHNVPLSSLIALNVSPKTVGAPLWFPAVLSADNAHIIASALGAAFFAKERETTRLLEQERLYAMSSSLGGFVMPSRVFNSTSELPESDATPISEALAWERDNERHLSATGPQIEALDGLVLVHNGLLSSSSVSSSSSTPTPAGTPVAANAPPPSFGEPSVAPPSLLRALYGIPEDYLMKHTTTTSAMDGNQRWPAVTRENPSSKSAALNPTNKTKDPSADRIVTSKRRSAAESSSSSVYEEKATLAAELSVLASGGHAAAVPLKGLDPFVALLSTAAGATDAFPTSGLLSSLRGSASFLHAPIASNFTFATRGRGDGGDAYAESSVPSCGAYSLDASDPYAPLSGALKMTWYSGLYSDSKLCVSSSPPSAWTEQKVSQQQQQVLMRVRGLPALSRHAPLGSLPLTLTSEVERELKKASTALVRLNRGVDCVGFGAQKSEGSRAAPAGSSIRQPQKKVGSAVNNVTSSTFPTAAPLASISSARVGPIEFALSERCSVLTIAMASGTVRECLSIPHVSSLSAQNAQRIVTTWLIKIEDVRQIRACQRAGALPSATAGSRSMAAGSVSPLITLHALLHIHNVSLAALSSRFSLPTSTLLQHNPELTSGGDNSTNVFLDPQVGLTGYIRVPIRSNAMIGRALSGALSGSSDLFGSIPYSLGNDAILKPKPPMEGAVLFSGLYATAPYSLATMGSALAVAINVGVSLGAISIFEGMLDPSVMPTPAVVVRPLPPHAPLYWNLSPQVGGSAECLLTVTWQHEHVTNVLYRGGRGQDRGTAPAEEEAAGDETATFVAGSSGTVPAVEQTVLAVDADFNNGKLRSAIERDVMSILQFLGVGGGNGSGTSAHIKYVSTAGVVIFDAHGEVGAKEVSGGAKTGGEYLVLHILCASYVMALAAKAHLNTMGSTCAMPHTEHALSMMGVEVDKTSSDSNPDKHALAFGAVPLSTMSLTPLPCSQESCEVIPIASSRSSAEEVDAPVDRNTTLLDLCLRYRVSADVLLALNPLLAFGLMKSTCPEADNDPYVLKAVNSLSAFTDHAEEVGHATKNVRDHDTLDALCQRRALTSNKAANEKSLIEQPFVTVSTQLLRLRSALLLPIGCFVQTLRVPQRPGPQEAHLASLSSPHMALLCPLFSFTSSSSATISYRLAQCGGSSSRSLMSIASSAQCAVHQLAVSPNALTARPGACLKLPQRPSAVRSDGRTLPMLVDGELMNSTSVSGRESRRERLVGLGEYLSEIAEEAGLSVWELALLNPSTVSVARGALVMVPATSRNGLYAAAAMLPSLPFVLESLQGTTPDSPAFTPHRGFVVRHAVQPHETILSICGRYNQGLPSVLRANPSLFALSGAVVLLVPANGPSSRREALLRAKAQNLFTVVIPSIYDTAANLSRRFDVSLTALADANKLVLTTSLTAASGGGIDNVSGGLAPQPTAEMTEAELLAQQRIFVPVISELGRSLAQQRNLSLYVAVGLRPSETVVTVADRYGVFAKDVMVLGRKLLNIGVRHIAVPVAPATATRLAGELSRAPASASPSYSVFFNFDVRPQESMLDVMKLFGSGSRGNPDLTSLPPPGGLSTSKVHTPSYVVSVDALHQGSTYSVATEVAGMVSSAASFTSALPAAALTESASNLAAAKLLSTSAAGAASSHIIGEDINMKVTQPTLLSVPITSTEAVAKALLRERSAEVERTSLSRRVAALSHAIRSLAGRNEATQRELKAVAEVRAALQDAEGVRGERTAAAREAFGLLPARSKTTASSPSAHPSSTWLALPTYAFNAVSSGTQTAPVTIAGEGYVSPIRVPAQISEAQTDLTSDVITLIQNEAQRADERVRDAQETVGRYKNEFDKLNQHKVEIEEEVLGLQRSLLTQRRLDAEANGKLKVTIEDLRKRLTEVTGIPYVPPTPSEANTSVNDEHHEESGQLRKDRDEGEEEGVQRFTSEISRSFRRNAAGAVGGGGATVPTESAFAAQQRQQQQRPLPSGQQQQQSSTSSSSTKLQEGGGALPLQHVSSSVSGLSISSSEEGPKGPMTRSIGIYADRLTMQERLDAIGFGGVISSSTSRGAALRHGHGLQGIEGAGRLSPTPPSSSMPRGGFTKSSAAEGPMISTTAGSFRKGGVGGGLASAAAASMSSPPSSLVLASEARNGSGALGGTVIVEDLEREGDLVPAMVMSKTKAKCLQAIAVRLDGTTNRLRADLAQLKRSLQSSVNELNTKTRVLLMPLLGPNITQQDIDRKVSEMEAARREEIDSRIAEGVRVITSLLAPQMAQLFDSLKKRRAINLAPHVNHSKLFTTTDEKNLTSEDWVEKRLAQYVSDSLRSFDYNVAGNTLPAASDVTTAGNNTAGDGRTYAFPPAAFSTPPSGRLSPSRFARLANRIEASAAQSGINADSLNLSGHPNKGGGGASSHNGAVPDSTAGPKPDTHDWAVDTNDLLPPGLLPPLKASMVSGGGSALDSLKASTMAAMRQALAEMEAEEEAKRLSAMVPKGVNFIDVRQSPLGPSPREIAMQLAQQRTRGGGGGSNKTGTFLGFASTLPNPSSKIEHSMTPSGRDRHKDKGSDGGEPNSTGGDGDGPDGVRPSSTPAAVGVVHRPDGTSTSVRANKSQRIPAPPAAKKGGSSAWFDTSEDPTGSSTPMSPKQNRPRPKFQSSATNDTNFGPKSPSATSLSTGIGMVAPLSPTALKKLEAITPNKRSQAVLSRVFSDAQRQLFEAIFGEGSGMMSTSPPSASTNHHSHLMAMMSDPSTSSLGADLLGGSVHVGDGCGRGMSLSLKGDGIRSSHASLGFSSPIAAAHDHFVLEHAHQGSSAPNKQGGPHQPPTLSPNSQILGLNEDEHKATIAMRSLMINPDFEASDTPLGGGGGVHSSFPLSFKQAAYSSASLYPFPYAMRSASMSLSGPAALPPALGRLRAAQLTDGERAVVATLRSADAQLQREQARLLMRRVGTSIRVRQLIKRLEALPSTTIKGGPSASTPSASALPPSPSSSIPSRPAVASGLVQLWQGWLRGWLTRRTRAAHQQKKNIAALAALFAGEGLANTTASSAGEEGTSEAEAFLQSHAPHVAAASGSSLAEERRKSESGRKRDFDEPSSPMNVANAIDLLQRRKVLRELEEAMAEGGEAGAATTARILAQHEQLLFGGPVAGLKRSDLRSGFVGSNHPSLLFGERGSHYSQGVRPLVPPAPAAARQPSSSHFRDVLLPSESSNGAETARKRDMSPSKQ